jgi:hypothetical protein
MSFETLNNDVLRQVAEEFAVDLGEKDTKKVMVSKLLEDGITWEMYKEAFPDVMDLPDETPDAPVVSTPVKEEPTLVRQEPKVLLKMERENPRFEIRGYVFSKDHPFLPVSEDDANYILSNLDGFRIAMPKEAEDFYS